MKKKIKNKKKKKKTLLVLIMKFLIDFEMAYYFHYFVG